MLLDITTEAVYGSP